MGRRHHDDPISAQDALRTRMDAWSALVASEKPEVAAKNKTALSIGNKVLHSDQLTSGLMEHKYSPYWHEPILKYIERLSERLIEAGEPLDSIAVEVVADRAASRFETLEFEARIRALEKKVRGL